MNHKPLRVLFLCTGNSARSIMAEGLLNQLGDGQFVAYSAGSFPAGAVNPVALDLLRQNGIPTDGLRSKAWDEFAQPGAARLDIVITVCDRAAGETCPAWPGQPMTAHWGIADPAAVQGSDAEKRKAFSNAFSELRQRIRIFTSLPIRTLDTTQLQARLNAIGRGKLTDDIARGPLTSRQQDPRPT